MPKSHFGDPKSMLAVKKEKEQIKRKEEGKYYAVTMTIQVTSVTEHTEEYKIIALDENDAENVALDQFWEENDCDRVHDDIEVIDAVIEEIQSPGDDKTLEMFNK